MAQFIAHMVLSVYMLMLCISGGFWYFGTELQNAGLLTSSNRALATSLDFNELSNEYNSTVQDASSATSGFSTTLIFGDFYAAVNMVFSIISGEYVGEMLRNLGFPESMQTITRVIISGFGGVVLLAYYIGGRQ